MATSIRWQRRVHRPFHEVYNAFQHSDADILQLASNTATNRTQQHFVSKLQSSIGGLEMHRDIIVEIESKKEVKGKSHRRMVIDFSWRALEAASLFPTMEARLSILPVGDQAQLDFRGEYLPPGGIVGQAIDAIIGEKIAESAVRHFVDEVVERLYKIIPAKPSQLVTR